MAGCWEHGNEPSVFTNVEEFLFHLSDYQLLKTLSLPVNYSDVTVLISTSTASNDRCIFIYYRIKSRISTFCSHHIDLTFGLIKPTDGRSVGRSSPHLPIRQYRINYEKFITHTFSCAYWWWSEHSKARRRRERPIHLQINLIPSFRRFSIVKIRKAKRHVLYQRSHVLILNV